MSESYAAVFETKRGSVMRCRCCGRLLVRYGNALLTVDADDFEQVRTAVAAFDSDAPATGSWPVDHAVLHADKTGVGFAFNRAEIVELNRLLNGAKLLLELDPGGRRRHARPPADPAA